MVAVLILTSVACDGAATAPLSTPSPERAATARPEGPTPTPRAVAPPAQAGSVGSTPPTASAPTKAPSNAPPPSATTPPERLYLPQVSSGDAAGIASALTPEPTATPAPTATVALAPLTPEPAKPTATSAPPPPAPTAVARVKAPPSPYQRLQDYPRPPGDSGYGFHINAEPKPPSKQVLETQVIPLMKSLGATWATVYCSSADVDEWIESVRYLVDNGFEVIVRYHEVFPPHPTWVPPEHGLKRFRDAGVNYFVTGNEPNLKLENPGSANAALIAEQWMKSADRIKAVGGVPLLYPMSPGGGDVADAREMLVGMLEWLKAHDALDTLDGAGIAIHNRPFGKPLDWNDNTSFREYEWIDDTVARYAGKHLPLFGTEAGYAFGEQLIPSLPRVDGELHKQYNLEIITGFRDGRWRDSLFSQTFWMLGGFGYREFISDWWVENPVNYGKDLPVVEALKALPKFTRKFNEPGFETRPRP